MSRGRHGAWGAHPVLAVALLAALAVACVGDETTGDAGGDPAASTDEVVAVSLGEPDEFGLHLSGTAVRAGRVQFTVENTGELLHAFAVVPYKDDPATLPLEGPAVETSQLEVLAEIAEMNPSATGTVTIELEPGQYVVFCNIAGHYTAGMWRTLAVE